MTCSFLRNLRSEANWNQEEDRKKAALEQQEHARRQITKIFEKLASILVFDLTKDFPFFNNDGRYQSKQFFFGLR